MMIKLEGATLAETKIATKVTARYYWKGIIQDVDAWVGTCTYKN